jgi:ribosomal protein S18 acetylase RimI-like enzyme
MTNEQWAARTANAPFVIAAVRSDEDLAVARELFRQYGTTPDVDVCVVGFADEIEALPGPYAEPRGTILVARVSGQPVGCVALKPVGADVAEMKRLFVDPACRGRKIGEGLTTAAIEAARGRGYSRLRLDSLPSMTAAQAIYRRAGFKDVAPWAATPVPGVSYLELTL